MTEKKPILQVKNLTTRFTTPEGIVYAASDISFDVHKGEIVGIVGESGSGKTQIFLTLMGLLASNGKSTGQILFRNQDLLSLSKKELNKLRGDRISMIFQDPMTSLNPYMKVSQQMVEVLIEHQGMSMADARKEALEMLDHVQIPEAKKRFEMFPHEFSGGMRQRVMIAMSLLCKPDLLIADEPTTALDVTIQAQILDLMKDLQKELNMAIVFITHDLGVVARLCDRVFVMYAGRIVEKGSVRDIFYDPQHPYSEGLVYSTPRLDEKTHGILPSIPGQPPNLMKLPTGCSFRERCQYAIDKCQDVRPILEETEQRHKACHLDSLKDHPKTETFNGNHHNG